MQTEQAGIREAEKDCTSVEQERGLSYSVIDTVDQFLDEAVTLRMLVSQYLESVPDKYDADQIMDMMQIGVGKMFTLVVKDDGHGVALLTAFPAVNDGVNSLMVHIGYAKGGHDRTLIKVGLGMLEEWAKERGYVSLLMQTGRKESSFSKFIGKYGWKKATIVYEKELANG